MICCLRVTILNWEDPDVVPTSEISVVSRFSIVFTPFCICPLVYALSLIYLYMLRISMALYS